METDKKPVNGTETEGGICAEAVPIKAALDAVRESLENEIWRKAVLAALENLDARLKALEGK